MFMGKFIEALRRDADGHIAIQAWQQFAGLKQASGHLNLFQQQVEYMLKSRTRYVGYFGSS